jgi:hypothetical protein
MSDSTESAVLKASPRRPGLALIASGSAILVAAGATAGAYLAAPDDLSVAGTTVSSMPAPSLIGVGFLGLGGALLVVAGLARRRRERAITGSVAADAEMTPIDEKPAKVPLESLAPGVYGPEISATFASGLRAEVAERGLLFFRRLAKDGEIDSAVAAELLGIKPTELAGRLMTPIRRRAEALSLALPYAIARAPKTRQRIWRDHLGNAARLGEALEAVVVERATAGLPVLDAEPWAHEDAVGMPAAITEAAAS